MIDLFADGNFDEYETSAEGDIDTTVDVVDASEGSVFRGEYALKLGRPSGESSLRFARNPDDDPNPGLRGGGRRRPRRTDDRAVHHPLGHRTALVDRKGGRYQSVASVHNLVGVSEDASGHDVSALAIDRLDQYGADVYRDGVREIEQVTKEFDGSDETADFENAADAAAQFRIVADSVTLRADRVMLATGFEDVPPRVRGLRRFVGRGLHYCLLCDAHTLGDEPVFVLGHSDLAAEVAMLMLNFTADVDLLPDDEESPWLGGLEFADGQRREYGGGFAVYSMEYDAELAAGLGYDLADDGAIEVDENCETSVSGVYAVGDVTHGQNQTPIAIGDGAYEASRSTGTSGRSPSRRTTSTESRTATCPR
jgi:thioredoxin reductase (NADPH)